MATGLARAQAPAHATAIGAPLLVVDDVTLQYKTDQSLVTATFKVGFEVFASERPSSRPWGSQSLVVESQLSSRFFLDA